MSDIPGWDEEIHDAIKALALLVGDRLPLMTTGDGHPQTRQLAAAYLARVRRLVMGMDVLYEAGMPDVLGGVLRVCFENWLTGMWVLVAREDALERLSANHAFRSNQVIKGQPGPPATRRDEGRDLTSPMSRRGRNLLKRTLSERGTGRPGNCCGASGWSTTASPGLESTPVCSQWVATSTSSHAGREYTFSDSEKGMGPASSCG